MRVLFKDEIDDVLHVVEVVDVTYDSAEGRLYLYLPGEIEDASFESETLLIDEAEKIIRDLFTHGSVDLSNIRFNDLSE